MEEKKCNCNEPYDAEYFQGGYPYCPIHDKRKDTATQLPVEVTEEIKMNAEDFANKHINGRAQPDAWEIVFKAHVAGATAENDRAQVLVDALEAIEKWCIESGLKSVAIDDPKGMAIYHSLHLAKNALEQWKSGKGKEAER